MPTTTQRTLSDRQRGGTPVPLAAAGDPPRRRTAKRGGLLAAVALSATCGLTTLLLATGVAAGAGLAGHLELTVAALAVPLTLLAWRQLQRARGRRSARRREQP